MYTTLENTLEPGQPFTIDLVSRYGKGVRLFNHDVYMVEGFTIKKKGRVRKRKPVINEKRISQKESVVTLAQIYPFIKTVINSDGKVIARRKELHDSLRVCRPILLD